MKAIILSAGKGTRMAHLTVETPKPLLHFQGESLLENKLKNISDLVSEIIIVVGYFGEKIKKEFGDSYNGKPIRYFEQTTLLGTADALWTAREYLQSTPTENFMVLMADDIYSRTDLEKLSKTAQNEWAMLCYDSDRLPATAKFIVDESMHLLDIVADPEGKINYNYIYTGACVLTKEIFETEMTKIDNGEFGLPQTIQKCAEKIDIKIILTKDWKRISTP
ncbi:MAG TPA: sugar phosphate nucleotidyltransferase, partial [Candidatus Paceibacterota bacterium]|nr:sugar phosphate nucleotidyltransferase [Candidatus Paceibacterota bacterium]